MQTEFHSTRQVPDWEWGVGYTPGPWIDPFVSEPQIEGRSVERISDIRSAPGGDKFSILDNKFTGSILLVRVLAAASDQFTLYIENEPSKETTFTLRAGIHLDASQRTAEAKLTNYIIKFDLQSAKKIDISMLKGPLSVKSECPLAQAPKDLPLGLVKVNERQKRLDHHYSIFQGEYKHGKISLLVTHSFPVIGFNFEYESQLGSSTKILRAELIAIEDHSALNCSCSRIRDIDSLIEIELAKLNLPELDQLYEILVWGPHDTQWCGETELRIKYLA